MDLDEARKSVSGVSGGYGLVVKRSLHAHGPNEGLWLQRLQAPVSSLTVNEVMLLRQVFGESMLIRWKGNGDEEAESKSPMHLSLSGKGK